MSWRCADASLMTDYQLSNLNSRSFEQLIQAISLAVIGGQVVVFGDGPDGGRDASFEGQVAFPDASRPWVGRGIVQAKFRQEPDSAPKKNADWLLAELKGEFDRFRPARPSQSAGRKRQRRRGLLTAPEYYVIATNFSLSGVAGRGGKDRVVGALEGFKATHGLRGYAIWDEDQIRRYLDNYQAIRTTYAAWLLPGDVLALMVEQLGESTPEFAATMRRYLESQLLDEQFAKLGQGGYTDANSIPLSNVFVDLPVDRRIAQSRKRGIVLKTKPGEVDRPTFLDSLLAVGREVLRPSANPKPKPGDPSTMRLPGRVVLIGGPGQGKTTVGQFACQLHRAALLGRSDQRMSPEVAQAIERLSSRSESTVPKVHALRYPVRVDLKAFAEALAKTGDGAIASLLEYLVKDVTTKTDAVVSKQRFRKWLHDYPWLLVLDGLDEVPASSNRATMMKAIRDFVAIEAHQADADLLILATTRPQGYSDDFDPTLYDHVQLAPLNAGEAIAYGSKLAEARHPGLKTRVSQLTSALKRATANAATVRLMESPLQVTIMLALIEGGGEPPEQRWKLFHDYYDVIYRREKERGTPFSAVLGRYEPDIHWLHHRAGWILQARNAEPGTTAARLSHAEFEEMVDKRLLDRGHKDNATRGKLVIQIREAATDRLVLLVGNTAKEIGFEIRSLQEFMAAEHCFDGPESTTQETVKTIAPYAYWRNVFLFVAGRIFFEKESLIDTLLVASEKLNELLTDRTQARIASGSRLALTMLQDGVARNQPENTRLLARRAAQLLDAEALDVSAFVEVLGGEAFEVWKDELTRRVSAQDSVHAHSAWRLVLQLAQNDAKWAQEIVEQHLPWRHQDLVHLLDSSLPGPPVSKWLWDLCEKHAHLQSPLTWRNVVDRYAGPRASAGVLPALHLIFSRGEHGGLGVADELGNPTCNGLNCNLVGAFDRWSRLVVPAPAADTHTDWAAFAAVAAFARDANPSGLARQLGVLLNSDILKSPRFGPWIFPWQVSACIAAAATGLSAGSIRDAVLGNAIGSQEDWARWAAAGRQHVKITQLRSANGPLFAGDDDQGRLFEASGWSHHHSGTEDGDVKFARAVLDALPKLTPGARITQTLVDVSCFGLNSRELILDGDTHLLVEELARSARSAGTLLRREIIVAIVRSRFVPTRKAELLALVGSQIGTRSWLHEWDEMANAVNASCDLILAQSAGPLTTSELILALSYVPPLPFLKRISEESLNTCRAVSAEHRRAADVVSINRLDWTAAPQDLADTILELDGHRPYFIGELLDYLDSAGVHSSSIEDVVLTLLDRSQSDLSAYDRRRLFELLVKLVDRRPPATTLPDPTVRHRLTS
jgi:hypothetical protein